jgi:hypothetical protein
MNESETERRLRLYYQSLSPADSGRAASLVAKSIRTRRESETARRWTRRPLLVGLAAALVVAVAGGATLAVWRTGQDQARPAVVNHSPSAASPTSIPRPSSSATPTPTARPNATLRAATGTTPSGHFSSTGSMGAQYTTATLLLDGRVLVTGPKWSAIGQAPAPSAQLYDPATGKFSATGSMLQARTDASATRLQDGRVLIAGGDNGSIIAMGGQADVTYFATAELYDPATGQFSETGSMVEGLAGQSGTLLADGNVLITGGLNDWASSPIEYGMPTAELYDVKTGTFKATGSPRYGGYDSTATLLLDGRVLVRGEGSAIEIYDPGTGEFSQLGQPGSDGATTGDACSVTPVPDGRVLFAGGGTMGTTADAELFDPTTGKLSPTGRMTVSRAYHTATLLGNGKVLIAGGEEVLPPAAGRPGPGFYDPVRVSEGPAAGFGSTYRQIPLKSAELYDPATGKFSATGSMQVARTGQIATLLADDRVLIFGGDSTGLTAELYQP